LRNKVIEGIQKMGHVELIDVDSNEALKTEAKRRQEASAMGDAVCRSEVMTTLGAQYLIQGNITSMQGVKKTDSKGKTYYQGSVSYTLKIVDPSNGTLKGTQTFTHEGLTGNVYVNNSGTIGTNIGVAKDCSSVHIEAADDLRELIKANSRLLDMLYKRIELLENKVLL
jgi:hypothetical protein